MTLCGRARFGPLLLCGALLAATPALLRGDDRSSRVAAIVGDVDRVAAKGPFAPAWPSLERFEPPAWYQNGTFGIFIHWGLYSVPAFGNEWYPRNMYTPGTPELDHHVATFGPHRSFGYKDVIPRFTAARYDPAHWAEVPALDRVR